MILTHHGIDSLRKGPPFFVNGPVIDGIQYKAVRIGNRCWSYPIKYKGNNITYYSPNNNPNNDYMGLLYQIREVWLKIQPLISDGWRIPTLSDLNDLISSVDDPKKLISKNYGGTNLYGLNCELEGCVNVEGQYRRFGERSLFWSKDESTQYNGNTYNIFISTTELELDVSAGTINLLKNTAISLRLCKDVV